MTELRASRLVRLLGLLSVYALARVDLARHLDAPTFGWRPTDLAGIALNYYRNGFHLFYPQVMWGGAGAGHVEMEFPLQSFLTALLFKLFGVHDWFNVLLPLAFGFGTVWLVYELGRYLFGDLAGIAGAVNLALSPTLVYITDNGMWADPPMVFCGTLGLYWLKRWADGGSARQLWGGVVGVAFAILFKITALYLGLVVAWLFFAQGGIRFVKSPRTWLAALLMLAPGALWYRHAYQMYLEDGNTFGIIGGGMLKTPTWALIKTSYVYKHALVRIFVYHITPLASAIMLYGIYLAVRRRESFALAWLLAILVLCGATLGGLVYAGHIGYLLPILPICNLLVGLGFQELVQKVRALAGARWRPQLVAAGVALLAVLVFANASFASQRLNGRDLNFETALWIGKRATGLQVARLTRPGSLIIVVDHEMDAVDKAHSMTPPDVFYYGDRHGWYLSLAWVTIDKLEELRKLGAEYFVVSAQSLNQYRAGHEALHQYLDQHFRKLTEQDGIIYDLKDQ